MTMKKTINASVDAVIVGGRNRTGLCPVGYKYILGDVEYTVIKAYESDNTQMRELSTSKGDHQVVTLETIEKDSMAHDFTEVKVPGLNV